MFFRQLLINEKTNLSYMTISIFCEFDRIFIFIDCKRRNKFFATNYDRQIRKVVKNISIIVEDLNRCDHYKIIYRMLNVAEHKNFRFDENFMKKLISKSKMTCDNK